MFLAAPAPASRIFSRINSLYRNNGGGHCRARRDLSAGAPFQMRLLIVDDHPVIIAGCTAMFAAEGDIEVHDARDAESGLRAFQTHRPDISIIDIAMPGDSGLDLTRRILAEDPQARIIIFSMNDDPIFAARAIQLGTKGYITKNDNPYLLIEAVRKVIAGETFLMPQIAASLALKTVSATPDVISGLNPREREILRYLGAGLGLKEIAGKTGVSYKTVANTCSIMKRKLNLRSAADLVRTAIEYKTVV
jgi:DNA-binding NarL/FixJ family response regulator